MMSVDRPGYYIREWRVSYYYNNWSKWLYGVLGINSVNVTFTDCREIETLVIPLDEIEDIQRTTTGLIFSAVVIMVRDKEKHWFSSLPDKISIYNTVLYFWKYHVVGDKASSPNSSMTTGAHGPGSELLEIAYDSENTLKNAAATLHIQGEQIDNTISHVYEIQEDLDVADNVITALESWLGKWSAAERFPFVEPLVVVKEDVPNIFQYEVLFTKINVFKDQVCPLKEGILRVTQEKLMMFTAEQCLVHEFKWRNISRVRVESPWELHVTKYMLGEPDISYTILFNYLSDFLQKTSMHVKSKIEYASLPKAVESWAFPGRGSPIEEQKVRGFARDKAQLALPPRRKAHGNRIQLHKTKEVTESEMEQLSCVLGKIKAMALDVQEEENLQNEKLDRVINNVEQANMKLERHGRRIGDLL